MSKASPEADRQQGRLKRLAHRLAEQDPNPELRRGVRLAMTIGPLAGFGLMLLVAWFAARPSAAAFLAAMELGSFIGGGKFVIFFGVPEDASLGVWWLAGLVVYGDLATALIMMANMTVLYRMPVIGRRLAACHEAGWQVLHVHRWMRRAAWLGVAAFVAAPFQGSGAVVGTIVARIVGLSRVSTFAATLVGSATGCSALALIGAYARERVQGIARNPYIAAVVLAVSFAVLFVLGRWFMGQSVPREEAPPDDGEPTS